MAPPFTTSLRNRRKRRRSIAHLLRDGCSFAIPLPLCLSCVGPLKSRIVFSTGNRPAYSPLPPVLIVPYALLRTCLLRTYCPWHGILYNPAPCLLFLRDSRHCRVAICYVTSYILTPHSFPKIPWAPGSSRNSLLLVHLCAFRFCLTVTPHYSGYPCPSPSSSPWYIKVSLCVSQPSPPRQPISILHYFSVTICFSHRCVRYVVQSPSNICRACCNKFECAHLLSRCYGLHCASRFLQSGTARNVCCQGSGSNTAVVEPIA